MHQEFVIIYKDFVQIKFFSTVKINTVVISKVSNTFFGFLKPADQHRDTHVVSLVLGQKVIYMLGSQHAINEACWDLNI